MKVTTLRFGRDLWRMLEVEAALVGTSASQYVREAALARAAAAAAARGDDPFELLAAAGVGSPDGDSPRPSADLRAQAQDARADAQAVRAESRQTRTEASRKRARASRISADDPAAGGSVE